MAHGMFEMLWLHGIFTELELKLDSPGIQFVKKGSIK